jgi:hypothetical protein
MQHFFIWQNTYIAMTLPQEPQLRKGGTSLKIKLVLKFYVAHPTLYTPSMMVTNSEEVRDDHDT